MATTFNSPSKKFDNHPEGAFAAVCADVYTEEKENPKYNTRQKNQRTGQMELDTRKTVTKVRIKFFTEALIEVDGKALPRVVMYFGNFAWGDNAYLRKFVRGWVPEIGRMDQSTVDLDALIGRKAWVTVSAWESGDGTSVTNAVALPPGLNAPAIPADFIRHKDKDGATQAAPVVKSEPAPAARPQHIPDGPDTDPLPF